MHCVPRRHYHRRSFPRKLKLLEKLAALIPRPYVNLIVYPGVLAPTLVRPAASVNILESRRCICDGVDNTRKMMSGWRASTTGFTSVRLHSLPMSLTPGGHEAIVDAIALAEVDLVGRLSIKSMMGHFRVVLPNVEIDELLELREAFE